MQIFFFVEQKVFTGTHGTSVCIFYPKCQNRKRLLETKALSVAVLSGVSAFSFAFSLLDLDCSVNPFTIRLRGARAQAPDQP